MKRPQPEFEAPASGRRQIRKLLRVEAADRHGKALYRQARQLSKLQSIKRNNAKEFRRCLCKVRRSSEAPEETKAVRARCL